VRDRELEREIQIDRSCEINTSIKSKTLADEETDIMAVRDKDSSLEF